MTSGRKPEIVLTSRFALDRAGGIESTVRELAERIARQRPAWTVRSVHAFDGPNGVNRIPFLGDLVAAIAIAARAGNADVVVINGAEYAWPRLLAARGRRRTIVVWHGTRVGEIPALVERMSFPVRVYLALETWLQRIALRAKRQIAVSVSTIEELRRTYGAIPNVVLAPNGATFVNARPTEEGVRAHDVVWIGTTPYKKGLDVAIEACRILRSTTPSLKLVAIGTVPTSSGEREPWIEWTGPLDHASTLARMKRCGVFLGTTRYEGCSVAVIEALALGLPVVASPAIAWMIADGGVAVSDYRPESFARALEPLLASATLRDDLAKKAVARSTYFSWASAANAYVREIESCLGA